MRKTAITPQLVQALSESYALRKKRADDYKALHCASGQWQSNDDKLTYEALCALSEEAKNATYQAHNMLNNMGNKP